MSGASINIKSGQTFSSAAKKGFKNRLLVIGVAVFMAVASVPLFSPSAFAAVNAGSEYAVAGTVIGPNATVPNRFECSRWNNTCRQVNGAYVPGLPHACRMVWSIFTGPYNTSQCHPNLWW